MAYVTEMAVPVTSARFQARLDADGITKCLGIDESEFMDALGTSVRWSDTARDVCDCYDGEPIFRAVVRTYRDGSVRELHFTLDGERL